MGGSLVGECPQYDAGSIGSWWSSKWSTGKRFFAGRLLEFRAAATATSRVFGTRLTAVTAAFHCAVLYLTSSSTRDSHHVFDSSCLAEQQFAVTFQWMSAGNDFAEGVGPALLEDAEITDRILEGWSVGVDRADDRLVHQDHL